MKTRVLLGIHVILLYGSINVIALKRSHKNAEDLIDDICDKLFNEDFRLEENRRWEKLCKNWITSVDHRRNNRLQSENNIDEIFMEQNYQPRLSRSRSGGSRSGSSRRSGGSSRSGGGTRTSVISARYRSRSTGATIIRPPGSLWSRTRYSFLPVSQRYYYCSRSSRNHYTTPATGSIIYYYCSANDTVSEEIQCSSIDGDTQCCEDETTHAAFCCGGKISDDLVDDLNKGTKTLARILYTLSALALLTHIFMQRFYR